MTTGQRVYNVMTLWQINVVQCHDIVLIMSMALRRHAYNIAMLQY